MMVVPSRMTTGSVNSVPDTPSNSDAARIATRPGRSVTRAFATPEHYAPDWRRLSDARQGTSVEYGKTLTVRRLGALAAGMTIVLEAAGCAGGPGDPAGVPSSAASEHSGHGSPAVPVARPLRAGERFITL